MTIVGTTAVSLTINGDDVDPDEQTRLLGCRPTSSHRKRDQHVSPDGRRYADRRSGLWALAVEDVTPGDLDQQVRKLLLKVTSDLEVRHQVASRHEGRIFAGFFMDGSNEMIGMSADTLKSLADRALSMTIDIYGPLDPPTTSTQ